MVLVEQAASTDTNHAELLTDGDDRVGLLTFARRVGLPGHALTVLPAVPPDGAYPMVKGIVRLPALIAVVADAAAASLDGRARVAADLRAHHNPRRMRVIAEAGRRLARRLATRCPGCAGPGWGVVGTRPGLPCRACGTATGRVGELVHGCPLCDHRVDTPTADAADPADCPRCNP